MDSKKILNLVTIVMFVITVVLLGLFMFGGEVPNQPVIRLFTRPKQAMKSFIGLAGVVVVILIGYALADGTPIKLVGYTGPDNVPSMLIFSDTILYTMYFLFAAAILAILGTEIYRRMK